MDQIKIGWWELDILVTELHRKMVKSSWIPDYIIGITRGGCIPAVMLSHRLGCRMHCIQVSLREGQEEFNEHNAWMAKDAVSGANILIMDDINDTGATFSWIREDWNAAANWHANIKVGVLVNNLGSNEKVDFSARTIDKRIDPRWISFPWEKANKIA